MHQPLFENSLIVSEYQLEFRNAAELEGGDGRVPTFIDNAFKRHRWFFKTLRIVNTNVE